MSIKNYSTPTKKYKALISAIHSVYRLVNSTYEVKDLISRLSKLFCQIFSAQNCMIMLVDPTKRYSMLKCVNSAERRSVIDKKQKIASGLEQKIIRTLITVKNDHLVGMPLISDDVIGVVIIEREATHPAFDVYEMEMLTTLIEQVVIGIRNLQLYDEQQRIVLGSIKSLVTFLDARVPQEYTHSPYFSRLVMSIGLEMHLDEKQIESLKFASLLHDTGKVDIPPEILSKTTKLTRREYDIIRRHPMQGVQFLRHLQVLRPVIPIIMHHHERYNGTGYPSRLKKGQIPLGARIMAVADAFEAMGYGRPYRERKNIQDALREIKSKSGSQFDPKVVEAFLRALKKINTKKYL
jgi:HD-GYP domain-containing protein (c-di-GMP phosphodiesterase class II)